MLGIDFGSRRVGVAVADLETRFARPLEVIDSNLQDPIGRIAQLVDELEVTIVVVGRPVGLAGKEGNAVVAQSAFLSALKGAVSVEVREYDERLTTVIANRQMRAAGLKREAQKRLRDAVAAQIMLQGYLDRQR